MSHTRVNYDIKMLFTACEISEPRYHELREKERYLSVKQKWHGLQMNANITTSLMPSSTPPLIAEQVISAHISATSSAQASPEKES